ncbi:adenylosuccinate lyase family protein [Streptomyces sp. NPDC020801]|uniref:class-II fumarase/aspartase family protein n=1 Tax=unclassified Streptomyces TaxID=2593676 RepID=UPI0037B113A2
MEPSFRLLEHMYADPVARSIWSADSTISSWLRVERELARAQAGVGLLTEAEAEAIAAACDSGLVEQQNLWKAARNVGYPILGLVREIVRQLPPGPGGRVHYGATTQDIMDSALSLQLVESCDHLQSLTIAIGEAIAEKVTEHVDTVLAARTHGQQAVPTTFGAKMAVYLSQFADCLERLRASHSQLSVVSLFGAGGTNAAMSPYGVEVRHAMAAGLGLRASDVPWHVARHRVVDFALGCAMAAAVCVRFAREVIDLSRNEIGELREQLAPLKGASSTMPQKANPIGAESIVGFGIAAQSEGTGLVRAIEAGHERSAGEWQAEWILLPQVVEHTASALKLLHEVVSTLVVDAGSMRQNLNADGGLLMSEAMMMSLAPVLGREQAHDLVYEAAHGSRSEGRPFHEAVASQLAGRGLADGLGQPISPEAYLGEARGICKAACDRWSAVVKESTRRS